MTKKELAYQKIREDIVSRVLYPGCKININSLASKYAMSAIPIREALTLLESENLVRNLSYRGYVVSNIALGSFLEYSLMRKELECLALRFAIAYLTDESLQRIKDLLAKMDTLLDGDLEVYSAVHVQFHRALYSFAPCPKIHEMVQDMRDRTYPAPAVTSMVPNRLAASREEHHLLVGSIEARDSTQATKYLFENHLNTLIAIVEQMKYELMTPDYVQSPILQEFFSEEQLKNRATVGGEIEYWKYILRSLSQ